ncbi:MlaE family lipid ABC transporter permease subunit [Synechococcus elongatus IITB4]|uniref:MlaE family lipid ABC transporter permease subunit n=1 Tax=Synechococcus elongatus TaxID=32046 RepID=UPI0030D57C49
MNCWRKALNSLKRWLSRLLLAVLLAGQVVLHLFRARIDPHNTREQMANVGPSSLLITLLTGVSVGAVFTIQVAREFINFGAGNVVGGVLALALFRELAPVLTGVVVAGRIGSAFAAEIGTMQVTEQIDALLMLRTDPVDYLVVPRTLACCLMMPVLSLGFGLIGLFAGSLVAQSAYGIPLSIFFDGIRNFLEPWDVLSSLIKAVIFGLVVAAIGTNWGLTTTGGARGVGESTTGSVVTSLLMIFVLDFFLSQFMFSGVGDVAL